MKIIGAGKFKATCLALLDEVARDHETIVVTKRGKPVARVIPFAKEAKDIRAELRGSVLRETNLINPVAVHWEAAS